MPRGWSTSDKREIRARRKVDGWMIEIDETKQSNAYRYICSKNLMRRSGGDDEDACMIMPVSS